MKRAGILLIVLAVLAAGFMAAANIVVADTGDEAHFESFNPTGVCWNLPEHRGSYNR